jgi:hypothetical protein
VRFKQGGDVWMRGTGCLSERRMRFASFSTAPEAYLLLFHFRRWSLPAWVCHEGPSSIAAVPEASPQAF